MGSIEKRGKNSWRVGVQVTGEDGSRPWIRRTLKLSSALTESQQRRQAEKALRQLEVDIENGVIKPGSDMSLRDLSEIWMTRHVVPNLSPVTAANYRHMLDCRILPKLGDIPVDRLTPGKLADFMAAIALEGRISQRKPDDQLKRPRRPSDAAKLSRDPHRPLSGRTLCAYYDLIDTMLDHAVQWEILWRNPMVNVDRPTFRKKPVKYLDDDQAVELLRYLAQEENLSYRCAVLLALTTGMRLGEVDGLTWSDVNFRKCTIDISKSLKYTGQTGTFIGDTKSEHSQRVIALPAGMMALLDQTKRQQEEREQLLGDRWHGYGRIVCDWDGRAFHHDTASKWFRRFARQHGFDVTFHQLRHTHATLLFANNIDAVAIASRLGHADAGTTLRIYAHALKSRDLASAAAMQTILDQASAEPDPDELPD